MENFKQWLVCLTQSLWVTACAGGYVAVTFPQQVKKVLLEQVSCFWEQMPAEYLVIYWVINLCSYEKEYVITFIPPL